ncbi:SDR family NAD(P)-dependent oxidoreductase [Raoultella terrigena]|uniref:SDR family NAD(P)-dependent oxidoreductase n=1 Tax=Raoultella terrigena TaxID=577 RepID=UPI000F4C319F|nr:SDR family NAD(P)-dependent oxidoreductase [Raoultella terrigena]ROS03452.1 NAD(P)-dependent dehydrogenase (short-subunit alcohol dehydrogenase family) [Raoultella terrigena]
MPPLTHHSILIVGASRGLGHAMAAEFLQHGWNVIGTVRDIEHPTPLHQLARDNPGRVRLETLDVCDDEQLAALDHRLSGSRLEMLFVNAGTTNRDPSQTIGAVSTAEFMQVMQTNALAPMRVIERLQRHVAPSGLLGVMSSGQGSLGNNLSGQRELYRGSKAALNMFMRSFAARAASATHPMVAMAPGWIRTALGGIAAPLTIEETIPSLVKVLLEKRQRPGLEYLDYQGRTVPW